MSRSDEMKGTETATLAKKRKAEVEDLEIDLDAPEPASKKALRKAKRAKSGLESRNAEADSKIEAPVQTGQNVHRSPFSIWIGNLPFSLTKPELQEFLTADAAYPIGEDEISRINLPANPPRSNSRPQNKGFAYVDFSTAESQQCALQLSEKLLAGRRVLIKSANNFEGRPDKFEVTDQGAKGTPSKRVFVGNLSFDLTTEGLENHFAVCGPIGNVHLATFEDSGKCKGYGWIDFEQSSSAAAAVRGWVEITNKISSSKRRVWVNKIEGRKLRMEFAEDKTTRYNKRFGSRLQKTNEHVVEAGELSHPEIADQRRDLANEQPKAYSALRAKPTSAEQGGKEIQDSRYAASTVVKLTGAIIAGQGTKTKFE